MIKVSDQFFRECEVRTHAGLKGGEKIMITHKPTGLSVYSESSKTFKPGERMELMLDLKQKVESRNAG